ncbi:hypothetical protein NDK43_09090 [Neobacillus pocheonensis]|uniref:VCBS repeat-containing protein n=1 Tax=Neobacillus pocheonensis TaxID=363869 RepID=A0ABT0W860_9BACI|nr:hypothetical protein [Neobacillus pocheonensis]
MLKKEIVIIAAAFFLTSLTMITGVYAIEEKAKTVTILKEETDITGDGQNEVIYLLGVPYQNKDSYLKKIYIEIAASNGKRYKIPFESGSKASLRLADLNHDGGKDLFVSVQTGGKSGITINYLYSLKDFICKNLTVPEPLEVESGFVDGYKANINIMETGKKYVFDLNDRKKYYKKLGLYHNGKLNEPTELTVNPYSTLIPIPIKGEEMGLKGIQRITGIANADTIGYVESSWINVDGKWKLVNADVQKDIAQK